MVSSICIYLTVTIVHDETNGKFFAMLCYSEVYAIEEIDFHVGDNANTGIKHRGAEHMINDLRYQAELQLVFKNVKYATDEEAYEQSDGFAVISLIFTTQEKSETERLDKSTSTTGFRVIIFHIRCINCQPITRAHDLT